MWSLMVACNECLQSNVTEKMMLYLTDVKIYFLYEHTDICIKIVHEWGHLLTGIN